MSDSNSLLTNTEHCNWNDVNALGKLSKSTTNYFRDSVKKMKYSDKICYIVMCSVPVTDSSDYWIGNVDM